MASHVDAGGDVNAGRLGGGELPRQRPDGIRFYADDGGCPLGRIAGGEGEQFLDPLAVPFENVPIDPTLATRLVDHGGQQVEVGVRLDAHHVAGSGRN